MTDAADPGTAPCTGCGAVVAALPGLPVRHPGASTGCAGLFEVTLRGLREEGDRDARAAALLQLATDAYDAQHLPTGRPAAPAVRLCLWLERGLDPLRAAGLAVRLDVVSPTDLPRPARWTATPVDVAADLDLVDLTALVRSWADAVWAGWRPAADRLRAAADAVVPGRDAHHPAATRSGDDGAARAGTVPRCE